MTTDSNLETPRREIFSAAELARREQMKRLYEFALANQWEIPDSACRPGVPCDWSEARRSLFSHPGVQTSVRLVASQAALETFAFLDLFEFLQPDDYLSELNQASDQASDPVTEELFAAKADTFIQNNKLFPEHLILATENMRTHADQTSKSLKMTLNFCGRLIRDWLEIVPAENFQALLTGIERLETAPVADGLRFLGLIDLLPMEEK